MSHGKRTAPFSAFSETVLGKMYADVKSVVINALDDLKKADKKRLILMNFPYVAFAYVCNKIVYLYRISEGVNGTEKMLAVINHFDKAFMNPIPSFIPKDILYGMADNGHKEQAGTCAVHEQQPLQRLCGRTVK